MMLLVMAKITPLVLKAGPRYLLLLSRSNFDTLYSMRYASYRIFEQLETRLRVLEGKELGRSAGSTKGKPKIEMYEKDRKKGAGALITSAKVSCFMTCHFFSSEDLLMYLFKWNSNI